MINCFEMLHVLCILLFAPHFRQVTAGRVLEATLYQYLYHLKEDGVCSLVGCLSVRGTVVEIIKTNLLLRRPSVSAGSVTNSFSTRLLYANEPAYKGATSPLGSQSEETRVFPCSQTF